MVKKAPSAGAGERARTLRRDMTEAERRLWQMLRSRQTEGYRFRRQVPIGGFIADFVCHPARLIVEIDGGQHDPSSEAEASRTRFLEAEGYRVLRFWNNEVLDNAEGVQTVIADNLRGVTPTHTLPHRGGGLEATSMEVSADCQQLVADLQRQLAECRAERDEALEYQTATSDVLNVISRSTSDLQPVLDTVVETAARLCGADSGTIWIREGEVYRYVAATAAKTEPEYWAANRHRTIVPGRGSIAGRAALEGRVVHVADIRADPNSALPEAVASGRRTMLGVPLLREGAVLGRIALSRKRVEPFTERQIELVRTFADQAVIAMENARLVSELQARTRDLEESLEYQTATSEVLRAISRSTADVQPVLDTVVETAVRLCGANTASIAIREGEVYRFVANSTSAADAEYYAAIRQRTFVPGRDNVAGRVLLDGRVVHIEDIRADPDYAQPETVASGRRTMLGVPLLREGAVLGTINLARQQVEPFTERQIELVRTFADQAVIAMENARLLGELQTRTRDLEESLEYQTATSDVLNVISRSTSDVQPVLDTVMETAARLCSADTAAITIREGEVYRYASSLTRAAEPEFWAISRQRRFVPGRDSLTGRVALGGRVVQIADIRADPDYAVSDVAASGRRTQLGVPLLREGEVLGTINLGRNRVEPFSERQIELVRTFADQAVIAIENARLLSELQARTRDLTESLEYQTATSDVLNVISRSTADVQPVLDTLVETAVRLCGSDAVAILIREGDVYRYVSSSFSAAEPELWAIVRQRRIVPGRDSIAARVALEGRVVHIEDIRAIRDYAFPETVASGRRTVLGVPLLRDREPIGVIVLNRHRVEPYTERQIELVRTFADQAVIAMENARLLGELQTRSATSKNRSNTRPRPARCSTSSAARPPMCSRCWTQWSKPPPGFAAPIPRRSQYARARFTATWRVRSVQRTLSIGRLHASEP
jgi:GAF domain-containing protein/very-short-patch-repair endonuclease